MKKTTGVVFFNDKHLRSAFNLQETCQTEQHSLWLIDRFGGDCASQANYIRYKDYLNIPCPGTGHDGDPNISIMLDKDIRDAVRDMLEWCTIPEANHLED